MAMKKQARDSLRLEANCTQFDVCTSTDDAQLIFLYEIYRTKADFDDHLNSQHFLSFSALIAPWVLDKRVASFTLLGEK